MIGVIANILCFALNLYYYKILKVESNLMMAYFFTHAEFGLLILGMSIVLMIFCNCGVTSCSKTVMIMYKKVTLIYSIFLCIFIAYFLTLYKVEFGSRAGEATFSGKTEGGLIMSMFPGLNQNLATKKVIDQFNYLLIMSNLCNGLSLVVNILTVLLVKIVLKITIEVPPIVPPKIKSFDHLGMSTASLKRRRIISLDNSAVIRI